MGENPTNTLTIAYMDNDNNENLNSSNETDNDTVVVVEDESAEDKVARLEEANKKLYERAKKAEGFTKQSDGSWIKKPQEVKKEVPKITNQSPLDILRDDAFKLYRMGYEEDEIDLIIRNGGINILKDENSPITLGLKAKKEQREAEQASSLTNNSSGLSEVEKKYTPEMLKNMTSKELEKILPHA